MMKMKKASAAYKTGESGKTYYSREQEAAARSMFLQNEYWKEYYEGAPGPECKAYMSFKKKDEETARVNFLEKVREYSAKNQRRGITVRGGMKP